MTAADNPKKPAPKKDAKAKPAAKRAPRLRKRLRLTGVVIVPRIMVEEGPDELYPLTDVLPTAEQGSLISSRDWPDVVDRLKADLQEIEDDLNRPARKPKPPPRRPSAPKRSKKR
jgi:hypothetical protein